MNSQTIGTILLIAFIVGVNALLFYTSRGNKFRWWYIILTNIAIVMNVWVSVIGNQ